MRTTLRFCLAAQLAIALPVVLAGCTLGQTFVECNSDTDCTPVNGKKLYCSPENLCVAGTPISKLCTDVYPATAPADSIVVGALVNTKTGSDGLTLLAMKQAIDEMSDLRVQTGERALALRVCEIGGAEEDASKSMRLLARTYGAVAVLGPSSSKNLLAVADEVTASGVPIMSASASSPSITDLPGSALFFRVAPSDVLQGPILASRLQPAATTTDTYSILAVNDAYGNGLQQAFLKSYNKTPIAAYQYDEKSGDAAFLATQSMNLLKTTDTIKQATPAPTVLIAITNSFTAEVVKNLQGLNLTTRIVMADGAKNDSLLALVGAAGSAINMHLLRITGTSPTVDLADKNKTGAYNAFLTSFLQKWKMKADTSIYTAYAYDATYAVGIAISAASKDGGSVTPGRVSEMLLRFNGTNRITVGRNDYLAAKNFLAGSPGFTLQGATGDIRFTPHGDRLGGLYEVWGIDVTKPAFTSMPAN